MERDGTGYEDAQKKLGGATPFGRARWPAFATMVVDSLPAGQSLAIV